MTKYARASSQNGYHVYDAPHTPMLLDTLIAYREKGVGVDMALKTVLGVVRLLMLRARHTAAGKVYASVADAIIECRMLCNFGRPALTFRQLLEKSCQRGHWSQAQWLFLCLSYFFRVFEQLSGDLNYLQKVVFRTWPRQTLSFFYRFFKSLSLTCCLVAEVLRQRRLRARARDASSAHARRAAFDEMAVSNVLLVRTLCDMYVYYKWLPYYTPIPVIEYVCGTVSGALGVWLVWRDTRSEAHAREERRQKWEKEASLDRLPSIMLLDGDESAGNSE